MADQTIDAAAAAKATEEATRKRLADERAARDKTRNERLAEDAKVKPTPTQEENDLAKEGVHVMEHEPDGSPEQPPGGTPKVTRQLEAEKPAPVSTSKSTYSTKTAE